MTEIWKAVVGFEGYYEVSSLGRVRSLDRIDALGRHKPGRVLKTSPRGRGYLALSLKVRGRQTNRTVHSMVLTAFRGERPFRREGAHNNGVKTDNRLSNLAWKTRAENDEDKVKHGTDRRGRRHPLARISETAVKELRQSKRPCAEVAAKHGISVGHAYNIRAGLRWSHV